MINHIFNPFKCNEICVLYTYNKDNLGKNLDECDEYDEYDEYIEEDKIGLEILQIHKLAFMFKTIYKINDKYMDLYDIIKNKIMCISTKITEQKYYYFGEFGFFNVILLGALEKFFKTTNQQIIIKAHSNFCKILKLKFPHDIIIEPIEELEKNREFHMTKNTNIPIDYKNMANVLNLSNDLLRGMKFMTSPIIFNSDNFTEKYKNNKYILIFPRNREGKFGHRNFTLDLYKRVEPILLTCIQKFSKEHKIIFIGHKEEVNFDIINSHTYVSDLEETIYLFLKR
jgi:hypothetical protein